MRNTTSITNPKTKSSNTDSNTGSKSKNKEDKNMKNENQWEASSEIMLNDADMISDILASHKALVKMYGTAICEIDCENLRNIMSTQLNECAEDQFDAFLYMNERGQYPTEDAPAPKIKETVKRFTSLEETFKG